MVKTYTLVSQRADALSHLSILFSFSSAIAFALYTSIGCCSFESMSEKKGKDREPAGNTPDLIRELERELAFLQQDIFRKDFFYLRRKLAALAKASDRDKAIPNWRASLEESQRDLALKRRRAPVEIAYPEHLPIYHHLEPLRQAIAQNQVIIVHGETGSGKSTQIPKLLLELGFGRRAFIGHTQPRRVAARMIASRIAEELGDSDSSQIAYKIRFSGEVSNQAFVKIMTDGVLLAEMLHDPFLNAYEVLIIDEVHERSLNVDFLLGYLKRLMPRRRDLKIIITSATMDLEKLSKFFDNAPIVMIPGKTYPVELVYRSILDEEATLENLPRSVLRAVRECIQFDSGAILVFLPGEYEIREVKRHLEQNLPRHVVLLPLYSRLSVAEQNKVFQQFAGRKIVLATNVAETSITIPDVRFVIDSGLAKIKRYNPRSGIDQLPVEEISKSAAKQRMGRAGRTSDGLCIRLLSQEDFDSREEYTPPEITRVNLAGVILQMLFMKLGAMEEFPFLDPPDCRMIQDGYRTLIELGAITQQPPYQITNIGRDMIVFPLDPRLARMIVQAQRQGVMREILAIASALSVQDPREKRSKADAQQPAPESEGQAEAVRKRSDFLEYWERWKMLEGKRRELSTNQFKKFCQLNHISYIRVREWLNLHAQIVRLAQARGWLIAEAGHDDEIDYANIHKSILAGFLSHISFLTEKKMYQGTKGKKFLIAPYSALAKSKEKWIVSFAILETQRVWGHINASIESEWILELAAGQISYQYFDPFWDSNAEAAMIYRRGSFMGLQVEKQKKVLLRHLDPAAARALFLRNALAVGFEAKQPLAFQIHNQFLFQKAVETEERLRRRSLLADAEKIYAFYEERLPESVVDSESLRRWWKHADASEREKLFFSEEEISQFWELHQIEILFPDKIRIHGCEFPLHYRFAPDSVEDGVTLRLPLPYLFQISQSALSWLIPGLLQAKIETLLDHLPKRLRRALPGRDIFFTEFEKFATEKKEENHSLLEVLAMFLSRYCQESECGADHLTMAELKLPLQYRMRIEVLSAEGKVLGADRDLASLQRQFREEYDRCIMQNHFFPWHQRAASSIVDPPLLRKIDKKNSDQEGCTLSIYPGLKMDSGACLLWVFPRFEEALDSTRRALPYYYGTLLAEGDRKEIATQLSRKMLLEGRLEQLLPEGAKTGIVWMLTRWFLAQREEWVLEPGLAEEVWHFIRKNLADTLDLLESIVKHREGLLQKLKEVGKKNYAYLQVTLVDITHEIYQLFPEEGISWVPHEWLALYPKYIQALLYRLAKAEENLRKDQDKMSQWRLAEQLWNDFEIRFSDWRRQYWNREAMLTAFLFRELRVSLFAQPLGTAMPVSLKKLEERLHG